MDNKKPQDVVVVPPGATLADKLPEHNKLACWQLRRFGYSQAQVSAVLGVCLKTVQNWDHEVQEVYAEMPAVRLMIDRVHTAAPKAMEVLIATLDSPDKRLRYDAAIKILTSLDVIKDRKTEAIEISGSIDDRELIGRVERILAVSNPKAGT